MHIVPQLPGYAFEFVPTPLSAGGVGLFISETYNCHVVERVASSSFQALWLEFIHNKNTKCVCGIV